MPWVNYPFKMEKQYRRQDWDYSNSGYYFITICTKDKVNLFRDITKNPVGTDLCVTDPTVGTGLCVCSSHNKEESIGDLNVIGLMVEKWWQEIPKKFQSIKTDKYVVMPNHFHGILIIDAKKTFYTSNYKEEQTHRSVPTINQNIFGNVGLLGSAIQWFKTMTTNEYIKNVKQNNWPKFHKQLWQPRFHDRIIRSEKELWAKRIYIKDNPKNWDKDRNNLF
jgi:REP element-mobilizing transposase RayT